MEGHWELAILNSSYNEVITNARTYKFEIYKGEINNPVWFHLPREDLLSKLNNDTLKIYVEVLIPTANISFFWKL